MRAVRSSRSRPGRYRLVDLDGSRCSLVAVLSADEAKAFIAAGAADEAGISRHNPVNPVTGSNEAADPGPRVHALSARIVVKGSTN